MIKTAERRMFAKTVIDSDAFLDMPLSSQSLYFHLGMRADDDGFVNNPKKIQRMIGASEDDLKLLIAKKFIIPFDSGVVVIKHWKIHNYIQNDRYKETVYLEEKSQLHLKDNGGYTLDTECIHDGYSLETQDRIGEDRLGQDSLNEIDSKESIRQTDAVRQAVQEWNLLEDVGISPVKKITSSSNRYKNMKARIAEYGIEEVIATIRSIRYSDFLLGKVKDFVITFDWLVKPNNFPKVNEGKYLNPDKRKSQARAIPKEQILEGYE